MLKAILRDISAIYGAHKILIYAAIIVANQIWVVSLQCAEWRSRVCQRIEICKRIINKTPDYAEKYNLNANLVSVGIFAMLSERCRLANFNKNISMTSIEHSLD